MCDTRSYFRRVAGQPAATDQSKAEWEVNLQEGSIEELMSMLRFGYSLLLDEGAAYEGRLRHAIVEALRKNVSGLVINTLS